MTFSFHSGNGFLIVAVMRAGLALNFYNAVDAVTNTNIESTGHSLGGGLAGYVGTGQTL